MSHLINPAIDYVITPKNSIFSKTWHSLETHPETGEAIEKDGSNIQEVFCNIIPLGLKPDFESPLSILPDEFSEESAMKDLQEWKLICADLTPQGKGVLPIHVAKQGYTIHQNRVLFDAMMKACQAVLGEAFEVATVGTLGSYSQFFVSISIKGMESFTVGKGDIHSLFFNLNSSHNSLIGSNLLLSVVRQVCMNTIIQSIHDADGRGTRSSVKHTKNSEALINAGMFEDSLKAWIKQTENHKALLESSSAVPMGADQFKAFASGIFTNEKSDQLSTVSFNRIEDMETLFRSGMGNRGISLYDGLNAFTEYFTSGNGVGNRSNVSSSKRLASANFGRGNEWKLEAFRVAGCEDSFKETLKRGEILYSDKVKTLAIAN